MTRAAILIACLLAFGACDKQTAEMKECLGTCASAEAQSAQCSGAAAEQCKKAINEAAQECRQLCQEHVK